MPELKYPGRGGQRKKEESEARLQRIQQLEDELGRALSCARRIERATKQLVKQLDVAHKNVFPGLEENRLAILRARLKDA
jgi:hypothetical protein